jgi:hypothetical protein
MPVKEVAAIRIFSTTARVVTFCVLRKSLPLHMSRVIHVTARARAQYTSDVPLRQDGAIFMEIEKLQC